jgi:membrane protease YdiL (CAAX protease family)
VDGWQDRNFWLAVAAAPAFWILLYTVTGQDPNLDWPFQRPLPFLQAAVLYPVLEEIVFRGVLQEACRQYLRPIFFGPLSLANLVTTLVFTALHFLYHPLPWAALVFVPSLIFGYFKDKYHGLSAPMQLHIFYNTGYSWIFGGAH